MNEEFSKKQLQLLDGNRFLLFQNSPFDVNILQIQNNLFQQRISSHSPIVHFQGFKANQKNWVCIVDSIGHWAVYQIGTKLQLSCQGKVLDPSKQIVGIHIVNPSTSQILFISSTGDLQYNYLPPKNAKVNKTYEIETSLPSKLSSKYSSSQLYSWDPHSAICQTFFEAPILFLCLKNNENLYSIVSLIVQDYVSRANNLAILNLQQQPKNMIKIQEGIIILTSNKLLLWKSNQVQQIHCQNEIKKCFHIQQTRKGLTLSIVDKLGHTLQTYKLTINPHPQLQSIQCRQCPDVNISILCMLTQNLVLTSKFEIWDCSSKQIIIQNNHSLIKSAEYKFSKGKSNQISKKIQNSDKKQNKNTTTANCQKIDSLKMGNYFIIKKQTGTHIVSKILTCTSCVIETNVYRHNMLLKMSSLMYFCKNNTNKRDKTKNTDKIGTDGNQCIQIFVSSPIIGTMAISVTYENQNQKANTFKDTVQKENQKEKQKQKVIFNENKEFFVINEVKSSKMIKNDIQSLFLDKNVQISSNCLISQKYGQVDIQHFFGGNVEQFIDASIVGGYILTLVDKQVHVWIQGNDNNSVGKNKQSNRGKGEGFTRDHVYCFETQVRKIFGLNDVNLWAAVLWDGTVHILQIGEKQSKQIQQFQISAFDARISPRYQISINTAPHCITLVSEWIIICSNDPLHVYQPQKTTVKTMILPEIVQCEEFYPVFELKSGTQRNRLLGVREGNWKFINIPTKSLVKDITEIKLQVEQILAFPNIQYLLFCVGKDNNYCLVSGSTITCISTQSGQIVIQEQVMTPHGPSNKKTQVPHLRKWLMEQEPSLKSDPEYRNCSITRISSNTFVLCGENQLWLAQQKQKKLTPISYFSMPNDAFIEFRNNLQISQLENSEFMEIFAEKMQIKSIFRISQKLFSVLFNKMIIILEIQSNGGLAIKQQIPFGSDGIQIVQFLGSYNENSLYLKDDSQRLIVLCPQNEQISKDSQQNIGKLQNNSQNRYVLRVVEQLQDQVVAIWRIKGWGQKNIKISIDGKSQSQFEKVIIRKDGQLLVGKQSKSVYL